MSLKNYNLASSIPFGVAMRKTRLGVRVLTINYRADPAKRGKDYAAGGEARRGYSLRKWKQEMENDWAMTAGKPVYPEFDKQRHESSEVFKAHASPATLYVGLDFGLSPAAVFEQETSLGQIRVLRVLNEENCGLNRFAPMILKTLLELNAEAGFDAWTWAKVVARQQSYFQSQRETFGDGFTREEVEEADKGAWRLAVADAFAEGLQIVYVGDPAGKGRQANEAQSGFKWLLANYGIRVQGNQKDQGRDRRINAVAGLLDKEEVAAGVSAFSISAHPSCDRLRTGFEGAYKFADNVDVGGKPEPVKDKFSHPQDAHQYVACHMFPLTSSKPVGSSATQDFSPQGQGRVLEGRFEHLETGTAEEVSQAHEAEEGASPNLAFGLRPEAAPSRRLPQALLQSLMP